jgi:hypothetical protein
VDDRMLIPALFVADAARNAALSGSPKFDMIVFVPAGHVTAAHRDWAAERAIALRHDLDLSRVGDIAIANARLSAAVLGKLMIPEHLAGRYRKILWLDADVVIRGDIGAIFRLDMGGHAIAARPVGRTWADATEEHKEWMLAHFRDLGLKPPYRYFNAGVLLIDVANWNRQQLTRRVIEFIRTNARICVLPDQDALSAVLDGDPLDLSHVWNARPPGADNFSGDCLQPVIVHYAGALKPWMRFRKRKGLLQDRDAYRLYRDFLRDTPWPGWLRRQWTGRDLGLAARHTAKRCLYRLLGREPTLSRAERRAREETLRRYHAKAPFADVEQGITLREGGRLRLAPATPPLT